jgi:hypothetical protein
MNDSDENLKYCPHCGTKIDRKASFCFACGSELKEEAVVQPEKGEPVNKIAQKMEKVSAKIEDKKEKVANKIAEKKAKKKAKKTYRKGLIAGIIVSCLIFSIIGFFIVGAFTFAAHQESFTFYYNQASPASVEECTIYADTASIQIQYNSTPVSYVAKADVDFQFSGLFMAGKTYQNFFNPISWINTSSAELTLTSIHWAWIDPTNWFKLENHVVTLTLRTDIVYDISATSITGGVSIIVPENVTVNDLTLSCTTGGVSVYGTGANFSQGLSSSTTTGSVLLNFTRCSFGDDITGGTTTGGVTLNTYNADYAQDITWTLSTTTGGIVMNIQQYSNMSASVTGTAITTTGGITAYYYDNSPNYGAEFGGTTTTGSVSSTASGFNCVGSDKNKLCTSNDFLTATNTYDLDLSTTTGNIYISGNNIFV